MDENDNNRDNVDNDDNIIDMSTFERSSDVQTQDTNINQHFDNVRPDGGATAVNLDRRTLIGIGWISALLTAFVSPYFAFLGVLVGVVANRQVKGSGTALIVTNIVFAILNLLFGFFLVLSMRRMLFGI